MVPRTTFIGFEPSFKLFGETLLDLFNLLQDSVNEYKRIDVELIPGIQVCKHDNLKVNITI
jgi:hypothetical protein